MRVGHQINCKAILRAIPPPSIDSPGLFGQVWVASRGRNRSAAVKSDLRSVAERESGAEVRCGERRATTRRHPNSHCLPPQQQCVARPTTGPRPPVVTTVVGERKGSQGSRNRAFIATIIAREQSFVEQVEKRE